MNTTLILLAVAAIIVIGLILAVIFAMRSRGRKLRPEVRERYASSWRAIEARFVDHPVEAVRSADELVVSLLRDSGRAVDDRRMPRPLEKARHAVREGSGEHGEAGTESMRRAMLEYREIVDDAIGRRAREDAGRRRREVAS
jgi:hypothetical protein